MPYTLHSPYTAGQRRTEITAPAHYDLELTLNRVKFKTLDSYRERAHRRSKAAVPLCASLRGW